jgi:hypothetical protein
MQGILKVEPCGIAYWLLSSSQVPLALGLTAWITFQHSSKPHAVTACESEEVTLYSHFSTNPSNSLMISLSVCSCVTSRP